MPENTEAQTYMKPKAQFQNKIRELEEKLAAVLKKNAELEEEKNKLLGLYSAIIETIPNIVDCMGGDTPVFVECDMKEFMRKNLESHTELKNTIAKLKQEIYNFGDYRATSSIWDFVDKLYTEKMDPESKNTILSLLYHKYSFPAEQVLQFSLNKMVKTQNIKENAAEPDGCF